MRRLALLLFAALPLAAQLGPEVPLSAPVLDAAAGDQTRPSLAWYGNALPAMWLDTRNDFTSVRIAQLDALGRPQPSQPIAARVAAPLSNVRIASSGQATPLTAMDNGGGTYVGPAGTSGRGVPGNLVDLITDGATYLLLTRNGALHATLLDAYGEELDAASFGGGDVRNAFALPFGGKYHILYTEAGAIHDAVFPDDDAIIATIDAPVAAAVSGDRMLLAWRSGDAIELLLFTPERKFVARTRIENAAANHVWVGSDGRQFLVVWNDGSALRAARVRTDGSPDALPIAIAGAGARDVTFARTPAGVVMAWSDGTPANVFTRGAASFDGVAEAPNVLASLGWAEQKDVALSGTLAVWSEGETASRIVTSDGRTIATGHELRHPAIAGSVIAWLENGHVKTPSFDFGPASEFDLTTEFLVRTDGRRHITRITPSGAPLETTTDDAQPVTHVRGDAWIAGNELRYGNRLVTLLQGDASRPAVAHDADGRPFLVWRQSLPKPCLWSARLVAGSLFGVQPLACDGTVVGDPALAWDGTEFVAAWTILDPFGYRTVQALRVSRDGQPLDPKPFAMSGRFRDSFAPAVAPSPTGVTIAYQRIAVEEPFDDVSRVFTRTLDRLGVVPRGRAAGR